MLMLHNRVGCTDAFALSQKDGITLPLGQSYMDTALPLSIYPWKMVVFLILFCGKSTHYIPVIIINILDQLTRAHISRRQTPGSTRGSTRGSPPPLLYNKCGGVNSGLKPGFGVLRCGPCIGNAISVMAIRSIIKKICYNLDFKPKKSHTKLKSSETLHYSSLKLNTVVLRWLKILPLWTVAKGAKGRGGGEV
jgi:hypothetical protein